MEGVKLSRKNEVSVFVNNLPPELDKFGLKGIFHKAGRVIDTYISWGRKVSSRLRYGFVRFGNKHEAARSIQLFNNKIVRGCRISVSMARTGKPRMRISNPMETKQGRPLNQQFGREWRLTSKQTKKSATEEMYPGRQVQRGQVLESIKGKVNEDFIPWLSRSLVCTTQEPRDVATLADAIIINGYGQCTRICALSGFKFILTFQSEGDMENALQNHEELDNWFLEVKKWDKYECCETRKVWLEVIGVPPHGWNWENFKKIADIWGFLICLGKPILRTDAFDSMKLLIETDILSHIERSFILNIEDLGFRVHVRELSLSVPTIQNVKTSRALVDEDVDSNGEVPGFEDLILSTASKDADARSDREVQHDQIEGSNHPVENRSGIRKNSNSNLGKANDDSMLEAQDVDINSDTRTKTAQFTNNECSEEIMMNLNHALPLMTAEEGLMINDGELVGKEESAQEPPGFEIIGREQRSNTLMPATGEHEVTHFNCHVLDQTEPPGFGTNITTRHTSSPLHVSNDMEDEGDVERTGFQDKMGVATVTPLEFEDQEQANTHPPGFECTVTSQPHQRNSELNREPDSSARRITRSQVRKNALAAKESPQKTRSPETSESMVKLAKEALEIGRILGIKVVTNERAALRSITASLKESKRKNERGRN